MTPEQATILAELDSIRQRLSKLHTLINAYRVLADTLCNGMHAASVHDETQLKELQPAVYGDLWCMLEQINILERAFSHE